MNAEPIETDSNHNPNNAPPAAKRTDSSDSAKKRDFVRRARGAATELPTRLRDQIQRNPFAMLGIAGVVGAGLGVVLSSRILRAVITATATAAALELVRTFVRKNVLRVEGS
jgi:ABC-type branched-subunit amino acid transport system permease subunit